MTSKYIKYQNIAKFQKYMTAKNKLFLSEDIPTYEELAYTPKGKKRLVLSNSVKLSKEVNGHGSIGLYLAPFTSVNGLNLCKGEDSCFSGCIAFTGGYGHDSTQKALELRTLSLYHHTEQFLLDLVYAIEDAARASYRVGLSLWVRLNATSDLPFFEVLDFEAMIKDFHGLAGFYDYTKIARKNTGYHLTFSISSRHKNKPIPKGFTSYSLVVSFKDKKRLLKDYPTIFADGDKHDILPLADRKFILLGTKTPFRGRKIDTSFIYSYEDALKVCGVSA